MNNIAIQGTAGSFHDQAAQQFFGDDYTRHACDTFRDVFDEVNNLRADFGVVAIENSLHGSINPVYRLLANQKLWVMGEVRLHIQLFLIGSGLNTPGSYDGIQKVLSQAEAISQCDQWLYDHLPNTVIEKTNDTADSARRVTEKNDPSIAAIAGKSAGHAHNGTILAGPINDDPENYTRFFILSKHPLHNRSANRTSIIMTERNHDTAGTLYDALGVFSGLDINLTKLDSHTLPGKARRYAFYIDFDANCDSEVGKKAIETIESLGWEITILGTYEKSEH